MNPDTDPQQERRGGALVVANRLPYPLDDGWKRRTFHVIRALAGRGPVTLVSLHAGSDAHRAELAGRLGPAVRIETARPSPLRGPSSLLLGLATGTPYHVWRQRSRALARRVREAAERDHPTVAIATMAHLYPYLRLLPEPTLRVIDTHNIDSLVLRRYAASMWRGPRAAYARLTARKLERHEREVFRHADMVWVCSEEERQRLAAIRSDGVHVVPNGVDAEGEFSPGQVRAHPDLLVFFGKMDYHPNRDAAHHFLSAILPGIRAHRPDVAFDIIGPGADADLAAAAAAAGARVLGRVDDLAAAVQRAAVVVVPLRAGGGTRLKILEALSLARPVVSTTVGMEGLELKPGTEVVVADEPADFAARVVELLADPARGRALGEAGRAAVRSRYAWDRIGALMRELVATNR